jgi:hypothetical protein
MVHQVVFHWRGDKAGQKIVWLCRPFQVVARYRSRSRDR